MKNFCRGFGMVGVAMGVMLTPVAGQGFDSSKADKADQKIALKQPKWDEKVEKAEKAEQKIAMKQSKWDEKAEKAEQKIEAKQSKWDEKAEKADWKIKLK